MRGFFLVLTLAGALSAQSMVEFGAITAGTAVGGVAGKAVSNGISTSLRKTGGVVQRASKVQPRMQVVTPSVAVPSLQVSPGVPKAEPAHRRASAQADRSFVPPPPEPNNVPPPPPPTRRAARTAPRPAPIEVVYFEPQPEPAPRVDIDLAYILPGMPRPDLLAFGDPSSRITMFEDGHVVEIYSYRNTLLASGSVRLIDGSVASIQTYP